MRKVLFTLIALLFFGCSYAHNALIRGYVTDESTKRPLANATILIEGTSRTTLTDASGHFSFRGMQEEEYILTISSVGFESLSLSVKAEEAIHPALITIALKKSSLQLKEVSVTGRQDQNRVSDIDLALRPLRTTQDLMRNVPGLFIAQHAGGGKAEQIFLRGFDCDHGTDVNVSVDGMPVNMVSHAHGQGYADLHWVIPETVESFRFGKGSYYADKGDFCTAGYVAFKTRDALDDNFVKAETGNFNTYRGLALLKIPMSTQAKHRQYGYIGGEVFTSAGPFQQSQDFRRYNAIGKYTYFLNPNNQLTFTGTFFKSQWNASGQLPERVVDAGLVDRFDAIDPTEGGSTGRINANLELTSQLKSGATVKNQVFYSHYDFNLYSNFTFFLNDPVNGDEINQHEDRSIIGYNGSIAHEGHIGTQNLSTQFGVGLRYDRIRDLWLAHTVARQFLSYTALGDVKELNANAWYSATLYLSHELSVNAALRYDNINYTNNDHLAAEPVSTSAGSGRFSPKLNFYYNATKNIRIFLMTGIGYHSNDARVAVPQKGMEIMPAAYSADLGAAFKFNDKLIVTPTLWALQLDQEFVYVGDEAVLEPSGRTLRYGADLSVRYQALPWLFADVDLNYSHGRYMDDPRGANLIPLAPVFTSIGGLTAEFKNGFRAAMRYRYMAPRSANADYSVTAHGYMVNDLTAGYKWRRYDFGLSIENLFNVNWNEAQFETETRLRNEAASVTELCFTPGTPFFIKGSVGIRF